MVYCNGNNRADVVYFVPSTESVYVWKTEKTLSKRDYCSFWVCCGSATVYVAIPATEWITLCEPTLIIQTVIANPDTEYSLDEDKSALLIMC